jgi:hypothetical protein
MAAHSVICCHTFSDVLEAHQYAVLFGVPHKNISNGVRLGE